MGDSGNFWVDTGYEGVWVVMTRPREGYINGLYRIEADDLDD